MEAPLRVGGGAGWAEGREVSERKRGCVGRAGQRAGQRAG